MSTEGRRYRRRSNSPSSRHHRSSHRRSRSPTEDSHGSSRRHDRERDRDRDRDRPRRKRSPSPKITEPVLLPSNAKPIDYHADLQSYFPMFAKYLDIQKSVDVMSLDESEMKSRFKRFVGRWNLGELAAGWYDKDMKVQADTDDRLPKWEDFLRHQANSKSSGRRRHSRDRDRDRDRNRDKARDRSRDRRRDREREQDRDDGKKPRDRDRDRDRQRERGNREIKERERDSAAHEKDAEERIRNMTDEELARALQKLDGNTQEGSQSEDVEMRDGDDSDDSDVIGPSLPGAPQKSHGAKPPTRQDLDLQKELDDEEAELRREDLRYERKKERKLEKDRLEELVPRAEPGSRERQLEKKRENAATNRAFADAKAGGVEEVDESALIGGDESFHQHKAALERKKNERELRKEALLRARKVEREERLQVHREKEEQTMKMLRALAEKFR